MHYDRVLPALPVSPFHTLSRCPLNPVSPPPDSTSSTPRRTGTAGRTREAPASSKRGDTTSSLPPVHRKRQIDAYGHCKHVDLSSPGWWTTSPRGPPGRGRRRRTSSGKAPTESSSWESKELSTGRAVHVRHGALNRVTMYRLQTVVLCLHEPCHVCVPVATS